MPEVHRATQGTFVKAQLPHASSWKHEIHVSVFHLQPRELYKYYVIVIWTWSFTSHPATWTQDEEDHIVLLFLLLLPLDLPD